MMAVERLVNNSRILTGGLGVVPFSGSLLSKAIAVLVKYGGSLWVAEPDDTFINSDGTGAASDGSDAGYVRDLCASYGPERVTDVELSTGNSPVEWTTSGTNASNTVAFSPGFVTFTTSDITNISMNKANALVVGSVYEAEIAVTDQSGGIVPGIFTGSADITFGSGTGTKRVVFVANNTTLVIKRIGGGVGSFTIDRVSVKEVIGRPLLQPTTGFKPKLKRVPKRLGPELVTNGDFAAGSTGWVGATAGVSFSGGAVSIVSASGEFQGIAQNNILQAGKTYVAQADVIINSGVGGVTIASGGANVGQFSSGRLYGTFTAPTHYIEVKRFSGAVNATVDNVSVREVLEWGWAWVGDGTDDTLVSAVQPTTNTAETMGVAFWNTGVNSKANAQHFINRRNAGAHQGQAIFQPSGSSSVSFVAGFTTNSTTNTTQPAVQAGVVASIQSDGTVSRRFANGEQKGTDYLNPYSFTTSAPIYLLSSQGSANSFCDRPVFAAYYAPAMLPAAERLIVERAMAQLGGVDI